mgnify:CR=1 FL=1
MFHILTLVTCVLCILIFYFLTKRSADPERTKRTIVCKLAGLIAFFVVVIRFLCFMKLYYFYQSSMDGTGVLWI